MLVLIAIFSFFAFANSASLLPVETSVNVKQSGQDYSYTIQENHGIAIEPLPHRQIPVIKIAPENLKHEHLPIKDQEVKPLQPHNQIKTTQIHYSPLAVYPTYYLPAHQYAIPYAYSGINYPYNLISTF